MKYCIVRFPNNKVLVNQMPAATGDRTDWKNFGCSVFMGSCGKIACHLRPILSRFKSSPKLKYRANISSRRSLPDSPVAIS